MMIESKDRSNTKRADKYREQDWQPHENKTEKIRVLVTPSFRKKLDQYLGDIPKSVWFARLAEKEINQKK